MDIAFHKYQGLGNDFVLIDNRSQARPLLTPEQAVRLCDRHFGIGADGVIFALPGTPGANYTMRIFNSDGSEPEMCGNGIRCLARFLVDLEGVSAPQSYTITTLAGLMVPQVRPDGQVTVDMGPPILEAERIPTFLGDKHASVLDASLTAAGRDWQVTCVSMGNPHCVVFVEDVADVPLGEWGPQFEHHPAFPQRTNTEFVQIIDRQHLHMRVWERGAGATLACGTGACAVVVAAYLTERADRSCQVSLPGGTLQITWQAKDNHVYMTGPAERVFTGIVSL